MASVIKTGVNDYGMKPSTQPSGKVCTDASSTVPGLPGRTKGGDQLQEVIYDQAGGLPAKSGSK